MYKTLIYYVIILCITVLYYFLIIKYRPFSDGNKAHRVLRSTRDKISCGKFSSNNYLATCLYEIEFITGRMVTSWIDSKIDA